MKKTISEQVEAMAMVQTQKIFDVLVREMALGVLDEQNMRKAKEDIQEIERAASNGAHKLLKILQKSFKPPNWPDNFQITDESIKADNIRKSLLNLSRYYHPDKLGLDILPSDRWKYEQI